jgi:hypothetical protein
MDRRASSFYSQKAERVMVYGFFGKRRRSDGASEGEH